MTTLELTYHPTKKWFGSWPLSCQVCGTPIELLKCEFFVDGVVRCYGNRWGIMCPQCYTKEGRGLGDGLGQAYCTATKRKILGLEGIKNE